MGRWPGKDRYGRADADSENVDNDKAESGNERPTEKSVTALPEGARMIDNPLHQMGGTAPS